MNRNLESGSEVHWTSFREIALPLIIRNVQPDYNEYANIQQENFKQIKITNLTLIFYLMIFCWLIGSTVLIVEIFIDHSKRFSKNFQNFFNNFVNFLNNHSTLLVALSIGLITVFVCLIISLLTMN